MFTLAEKHYLIRSGLHHSCSKNTRSHRKGNMRVNHQSLICIYLSMTLMNLFLCVAVEALPPPPMASFHDRLQSKDYDLIHLNSENFHLDRSKRLASTNGLQNETSSSPAVSVHQLPIIVEKAVKAKVTDMPQKSGSDDPAGTQAQISKDDPKESDSNSVDYNEEDPGHGPPNELNPEAMLRLFYVLVGIGIIVLIYILIKFLRFRRRRATRKYRALSRNDEQEMFPLAADDGDDEEIFNAADHHTLK